MRPGRARRQGKKRNEAPPGSSAARPTTTDERSTPGALNAGTVNYREQVRVLVDRRLVAVYRGLQGERTDDHDPAIGATSDSERLGIQALTRTGNALGEALLLIERLHPDAGEDVSTWQSRALTVLRARWLAQSGAAARGWREAITILEIEPFVVLVGARSRCAFASGFLDSRW